MVVVQEVKEIKIIQIGNSKGIRLPKSIIDKYGFSGSIHLEESDEGIFLRSNKDKKLSWEDTYKAMKNEKEDWDDFESITNDGLDGDDTDT